MALNPLPSFVIWSHSYHFSKHCVSIVVHLWVVWNISCVDMQYCYIVIVRVSGKKNNIAMHVSFEIMNESWYKILLTCYMRFIIVSDLCPCEGRQNCKVLTFQADQDQSYEGIVNIASDKLVRPKQSHWQRTVNISPGHRGNLVPTAPDIPVSGC